MTWYFPCLGFKLRFLPQSQKVAASPGEDWNCRKRGFLDFEIRIRSRNMAIFREKMWLFSHLSFRFDSEQNLGTCFSSRLSCSFGCNLHGPTHFRKSCAGTITVLSLCKWGRERQSSSLHHSVNLNSQALISTQALGDRCVCFYLSVPRPTSRNLSMFCKRRCGQILQASKRARIWRTQKKHTQKKTPFQKQKNLGGGNSNILYFHPYLGRWSNLTCAYFSNGLVQPPTRKIILPQQKSPLHFLPVSTPHQPVLCSPFSFPLAWPRHVPCRAWVVVVVSLNVAWWRWIVPRWATGWTVGWSLVGCRCWRTTPKVGGFCINRVCVAIRFPLSFLGGGVEKSSTHKSNYGVFLFEDFSVNKDFNFSCFCWY